MDILTSALALLIAGVAIGAIIGAIMLVAFYIASFFE